MHIALGSGVGTCPRGYILYLEQPSTPTAPRLGRCTLCSAGTYSVNPLYGGRMISGVAESPYCLACPAGGVCLGGDKVVYIIK
jgi:hypothetical protein